MGWPTIPASQKNDFVIIERAGSWTQDSRGGKRTTYSSPEKPVACFITPVGAGEKEEFFRESVFARYAVTFSPENPGLRIRDRLTWVETGIVLNVVGTEVGGDSSARQYHIYTEENATR
jgi:hypothetical protein